MSRQTFDFRDEWDQLLQVWEEDGYVFIDVTGPRGAWKSRLRFPAAEVMAIGAALSALALRHDIEVLSEAALTPWKAPEA